MLDRHLDITQTSSHLVHWWIYVWPGFNDLNIYVWVMVHIWIYSEVWQQLIYFWPVPIELTNMKIWPSINWLEINSEFEQIVGWNINWVDILDCSQFQWLQDYWLLEFIIKIALTMESYIPIYPATTQAAIPCSNWKYLKLCINRYWSIGHRKILIIKDKYFCKTWL